MSKIKVLIMAIALLPGIAMADHDRDDRSRSDEIRDARARGDSAEGPANHPTIAPDDHRDHTYDGSVHEEKHKHKYKRHHRKHK